MTEPIIKLYSIIDGCCSLMRDESNKNSYTYLQFEKSPLAGHPEGLQEIAID